MKASELLEQFKINETHEVERLKKFTDLDNNYHIERAKLLKNSPRKDLCLTSVVELNDGHKATIMGAVEKDYVRINPPGVRVANCSP